MKKITMTLLANTISKEYLCMLLKGIHQYARGSL